MFADWRNCCEGVSEEGLRSPPRAPINYVGQFWGLGRRTLPPKKKKGGKRRCKRGQPGGKGIKRVWETGSEPRERGSKAPEVGSVSFLAKK